MKLIDQPGVYDLPMDRYHADCCDGPSVSASGLWRLHSECPALFWEQSYLNPGRVTEEPSRALDVGKAAHALVLGEPEFNRNFAILPFDSLRTNEAKAWKAKTEEEGKTIIRADDFDVVRDMAAAQRRSPQVARAFRDGRPEKSLIWRDDLTGVWLKSRPDWLPNDPAQGWLIDYKTCRTLDPRKFSQAAFEYGYHVQAALQVDACRAVLGIEPLGVAHVVQEKAPPYLAELRLFTPEQIEFGRVEYRRALFRFSECWAAWKAGKPDRVAWPGYTTEPQYFETPHYIAKRMANDGTDTDSNQTETAFSADHYAA